MLLVNNAFITPALATFVYILETTWCNYFFSDISSSKPTEMFIMNFCQCASFRITLQWEKGFQNFTKLTCQLVSLNKIHVATEFNLLHPFSLFDLLFQKSAPQKLKLHTDFETFPKLMSNHNCSSLK